MYNRELFGLAWLGSIIHWLEELTAMLAGPILTAGLGLALVDLLTGGKLLADSPALLFAWAVSQALGLDAQLVGAAAKLGAAIRRRAGWAMLGYALLVAPLGYVAFQASSVFSTQQAEAISTAQALARLGMDSSSWIVERSALAVMLVILSGMLRYAAPAKVAVSLADERAKLERELTLEPLRQRLRAQQVGGWRTVAETALGRAGDASSAYGGVNLSQHFEATGEPPVAAPEGQEAALPAQADTFPIPSNPSDEPPPGGGVRTSPPGRPAILRLTPATPERRSAVRRARSRVRTPLRTTASREAEARAAYANGARTVAAMVAATGMGRSTASKWVRTFAEGEQAQRAQEA